MYVYWYSIISNEYYLLTIFSTASNGPSEDTVEDAANAEDCAGNVVPFTAIEGDEGDAGIIRIIYYNISHLLT